MKGYLAKNCQDNKLSLEAKLELNWFMWKVKPLINANLLRLLQLVGCRLGILNGRLQDKLVDGDHLNIKNVDDASIYVAKVLYNK